MRISRISESRGVFTALAIYSLWFGALSFGLFYVNVWESLPSTFGLTALLTLLWTGLFITSHDAMHGAVAPKAKSLNHFIGSLCAISYAMFDYDLLKINHHKHHRFSSTHQDPDYHNGKRSDFIHWLLKFIAEYLSVVQLTAIGTYYAFLYFVFKVEWSNLVCFSIAPSLLSLLQLFYFGTFLPHREPKSGYENPYRAATSNFGTLLSFFTCYHFGYHLEHHMRPFVPWWGLPDMHKQLNPRSKAIIVSRKVPV